MGQPCIAMHSKGFFILKGLLLTTKLPMNWKANFATPLNHWHRMVRSSTHNSGGADCPNVASARPKGCVEVSISLECNSVRHVMIPVARGRSHAVSPGSMRTPQVQSSVMNARPHLSRNVRPAQRRIHQERNSVTSVLWLCLTQL